MESTQNPKGRSASYTFDQIEACTAILREYSAASADAMENGGEVYEMDYLRRIAEALEPGKVMR